MKTLIKRPNYTLSIKTSCYSAFSFYTFFRNDRYTPALLSSFTARLTNQPPELPDRSFFILPRRPPHQQLHYQTILIASLTTCTNSFTDRTYFRLIYRRERTSPLLYIQTEAELKLQALSLSLKVNSLKLGSLRPLTLLYIGRTEPLALYI